MQATHTEIPASPMDACKPAPKYSSVNGSVVIRRKGKESVGTVLAMGLTSPGEIGVGSVVCFAQAHQIEGDVWAVRMADLLAVVG